MRAVVLLCAVLLLGGCATARKLTNTDQCTAPTPREAKITKKAWM